MLCSRWAVPLLRLEATVGAGGRFGEEQQIAVSTRDFAVGRSLKIVTFILTPDTISLAIKRVYVFAQLIVNALV